MDAKPAKAKAQQHIGQPRLVALVEFALVSFAFDALDPREDLTLGQHGQCCVSAGNLILPIYCLKQQVPSMIFEGPRNVKRFD